MLTINLKKGFTLVEMMVTVAIVAILAALAVPSFNYLIANAQIKTASQAILDGLHLARAEAIRRNERVSLLLGTGSNWSIATDSGVSIQTRSSGEGTGSVTVATVPTASTRITFNALGRAVANADASARITTINLDVSPSFLAASLSKELRITVTDGGSIRMCDPSISTTGDPRKC